MDRIEKSDKQIALKKYRNTLEELQASEILSIQNKTDLEQYNDDFLDYWLQIERQIQNDELDISPTLLHAISDTLCVIHLLRAMKYNKNIGHGSYLEYHALRTKLSEKQKEVTKEYFIRLFDDPNDAHEADIGLDRERVVQLGNMRNMMNEPQEYIFRLQEGKIDSLPLVGALLELSEGTKYGEKFVDLVLENSKDIFPIFENGGKELISKKTDIILFNNITSILNLRYIPHIRLQGAFMSYKLEED